MSSARRDETMLATTTARKVTKLVKPTAIAGCALSLAAIASLGGCAVAHGIDYARGLAAGDRAEEAGRFSDAARAYDAAAKVAKTREDAVHALFLGAQMHESAGELGVALSRFDAISALDPVTLDAPSATLYAAELRLRTNDPAASAGLQNVMTRFPDSGSARVAFHVLLRAREPASGTTGGTDATTSTPADSDAIRTNAIATDAWLATLEPKLASSDLGADIAYARAGAHEASGDLRGARDRYLDVATRWPYPAGDLWDDALWHASLLDEKLGDPRAAIDDLERMLAQHEKALLSGSYQRPRYTPAAWRVAELWRDQLHDRVKARDAFHRVYSEMTTSVLRDDALWQESLLWSEEGDTGTACERLETLASDFPDSRYVPCAAERCPRITRESKSRAPKTCRGSIERKATEQQAKDSTIK